MDIDKYITEMIKFNFDMMLAIIVLNTITVCATVYLVVLALK